MPIRPINRHRDTHANSHVIKAGSGASAPGTEEPQVASEQDTSEPSSREYEVGYRKPPRHTRFKPGQSGNPRGRPKGARGLNTIVRTLMNETMVLRTSAGERKIRKIDGVLQKTVELAMKGNMKALGQLVTLYKAAVPEAETHSDNGASIEELSATDLATLEELRALYAGGGDLA